MSRKISKQLRREAVRDYVQSNETLRVVALRYGISPESLRRFAGNKVRQRGKKRVKLSSKIDLGYPSTVEPKISNKIKRRRSPNEPTPRAQERWPMADDEFVRISLDEGKESKEIAKILGRSNRSVQCRKYILKNQEFIEDGKRFPSKGYKKRKSAKKQLTFEKLIEFEKKDTPEVKKRRGPYKHTEHYIPPTTKVRRAYNKKVKTVEKPNGEQIQAIKLEDLAAIVNSHNVSVSIAISNTGTEITIKK